MTAITTPASGAHQPRSRMRRRSPIMIDMTPMVDLAFLLLTFFVLTTTLNKGYVMELNQPDETTDSSSPVPAKRAVTFLLGDHDKIYWRHGLDPELKATTFSNTGLRRILQDQKAAIPKLVVIVKATDHCRYSNVVDILDELTIARIDRYAMTDMTAEDDAMIKAFEKNTD